MINTKKIVLGLLASTFIFNAFPMSEGAPETELIQEEVVTQAAPAETTSLKVKTIDLLMNKLGHIRSCLQGKETCTKTDFAVILSAAAFLRVLFYGGTKRAAPALFRAATYVDPMGYAERAASRITGYRGEGRK